MGLEEKVPDLEGRGQVRVGRVLDPVPGERFPGRLHREQAEACRPVRPSSLGDRRSHSPGQQAQGEYRQWCIQVAREPDC
ncbi:hypothetical protein GCM10010911_52310 [Paenibacillus nasutitermitis]|uniref:Uncharacterized protein n=1 Tax=Paenibacillus nasutitermitis TaxID=1652958 RepID=A0A917E014_9BACL|nr:hypothetical protein GCM10010911_52310 [Paenibacillus nasutitermitis]